MMSSDPKIRKGFRQDVSFSDVELLDFIQRKGIAVYPQRIEKHGPVVAWYVSTSAHFVQAQGLTVREALTNLKKGLDETDN